MGSQGTCQSMFVETTLLGLKIDGAIINENSGYLLLLNSQMILLSSTILELENQPLRKMTRNNQKLHDFMCCGWGKGPRFTFGGRDA